MKFSPHSSATRTLASTSSSFTLRNSCPSDDAPKLRMGSWRSVWPRRRVCMRKRSARAHLRFRGGALEDDLAVETERTRLGDLGGFEREVVELAVVTEGA